MARAVTTREAQPTLLIPSPGEFDFGTLPRGARRERPFVLTNTTEEAVEINSVITSCDCFNVVLEKKVVPAGEQTTGTAIIDFSGDKAYSGHLLLSARGMPRHGKIAAFVIQAKVKVE